ncbi:hypothetical protein CF640_01820 [Burkholderia pseudomallei]|nr:hypothetical protein CF640_01820 [Burkholderia pseudomallei]
MLVVPEPPQAERESMAATVAAIKVVRSVPWEIVLMFIIVLALVCCLLIDVLHLRATTLQLACHFIGRSFRCARRDSANPCRKRARAGRDGWTEQAARVRRSGIFMRS